MKIKTYSIGVAAALLIILALVLPTFAQDKAASKKKDLPQSGLLSSSSKVGRGDVAIGGLWGDPYGKGADEAPISGSVSRISPREWIMRAKNSSKDSYSVSLQVLQQGSRGEQVKSDSFSYVMQPGATVERKVAAAPAASDGQLKLLSWKNLSKKAGSKKTEDKVVTVK